MALNQEMYNQLMSRMEQIEARLSEIERTIDVGEAPVTQNQFRSIKFQLHVQEQVFDDFRTRLEALEKRRKP